MNLLPLNHNFYVFPEHIRCKGENVPLSYILSGIKKITYFFKPLAGSNTAVKISIFPFGVAVVYSSC